MCTSFEVVIQTIFTLSFLILKQIVDIKFK